MSDSDPWKQGRTLEWSIPTPAPIYNFAFIPTVSERDAYWEMKTKKIPNPNLIPQAEYPAIHMPKNTATGFVIGILSGIFGFGMVWHIDWMITAGLAGIFISIIARSFNFETDYYLESREIKKIQNG